MRALLDAAAVLVAAAALLAGAATLLTTRDRFAALAVLLELSLAAGLLRLAAEPSAQRAATAGGVLVVRRLVLLGLRPRGGQPRGGRGRGLRYRGRLLRGASA